MRAGRIRCFAWEIAEEYLTDFLNLFRAPGEKATFGSGNAGAAATFIYRHPVCQSANMRRAEWPPRKVNAKESDR